MLTSCQDKIFEFVREYWAHNGVSPSTRKVAAQFSIAQATALAHLRAIGAKGFLVKMVDGRWGLGPEPEISGVVEAPILGSVPAGSPQAREGSVEDVVLLDSKYFGISRSREARIWLLRVRGDSMSDANISDGDLVILVQRKPNPGDIIAALVDDTTATLKRLVVENGTYILRAANPRYSDVIGEKFECQGVAVGLIRNQMRLHL